MRNITALARRPHRPKPARLPHDAGISLVLLIAIIVALGALVSGVVSFLATSGMDTAISNLGDKVYYSSESGIRYLAAQYKNTGDVNGNGFADDDKANVLIALDGSTVNLPNNLGSFALDVYPYWFISTAGYAGAASITVRFPGTMPAGYAFPSSGVIEVEDNSPHTYTAVNSANAPLVTFTLSTPVTLAAGKSVYMTLPPTGSQSVSAGGSLTLSAASGSIFPDRLGQIQVNDRVVTYERATYSNGVLTLSNLSGAVSAGAGDRVVLKKNAMVGSQGQAGGGLVSTSSLTEFNLTFADDEPPGTGIDEKQNAQTTEMNSLDGFTDPTPGGGFRTATYSSGDGATETYVVTKEVGQAPDPESACSPQAAKIRYATLFWNKNALLATAWQNATSNHLLSYDVQVKNAWGYLLQYGTGGVSFRLHESATAGKYNTLGLSFMRYKVVNSCLAPEGQNDDIPDTIKPTTAAGGSLAGRCLLVLWIQEVSGGLERKKWVAYRDLDNELCIRGQQWNGDGRCFTDDSTLLVRVWEKMVNDAKTCDITVHYGDASNPANTGWWEHISGPNWVFHNGGCGPRTPNAIAYDYGTLRQVYSKNSTYPAGQTPFPSWPPIAVSDWNSTLDYYTFVEHGGGNPVACTLCDWDRVNPAVSADFQLQSDGGALRTTKFLSPSNGTFPANRAEIGLHNFGGGSGNWVIGWKDFSVQLLIPNAGTVGGVSGTVMH